MIDIYRIKLCIATLYNGSKSQSGKSAFVDINFNEDENVLEYLDVEKGIFHFLE